MAYSTLKEVGNACLQTIGSFIIIIIIIIVVVFVVVVVVIILLHSIL